MKTIDIIEELLLTDGIARLTIKEYPKQYLLQERFRFDNIESVQFEQAMIIRNKLGLPFWDSVMLTFFNNKNGSINILKNAYIHNRLKEFTKIKDTKSLRQILIDKPDLSLALNSVVEMGNGKIRHLQLLDFHIPVNNDNLPYVREILKLLNAQNGYILNSGESYHYIGYDLMKQDEFYDFLSRALLFSPIIDRAWIAHQLIERSSSLRISNKHCIQPILIEKYYGK